MRVISGIAGGLHLKVPKTGLRPTQDRIREVVFSSLGEFVIGARVLDLFAGTGSFGIEALSRGAASSVFVESDSRNANCITDNLRHCRLSGHVVKQDALDYLAHAGGQTFDLIFADPPYEKKKLSLDAHPLLGLVMPLLGAKGIFVWEHYSAQTVVSPPGWKIIRDRSYGETGLTFLQPLEPAR